MLPVHTWCIPVHPQAPSRDTHLGFPDKAVRTLLLLRRLDLFLVAAPGWGEREGGETGRQAGRQAHLGADGGGHARGPAAVHEREERRGVRLPVVPHIALELAVPRRDLGTWVISRPPIDRE